MIVRCHDCGGEIEVETVDQFVKCHDCGYWFLAEDSDIVEDDELDVEKDESDDAEDETPDED
jgi:Zn finger protein HypA/HybF involved in hydrogenase expression